MSITKSLNNFNQLFSMLDKHMEKWPNEREQTVKFISEFQKLLFEKPHLLKNALSAQKINSMESTVMDCFESSEKMEHVLKFGAHENVQENERENERDNERDNERENEQEEAQNFSEQSDKPINASKKKKSKIENLKVKRCKHENSFWNDYSMIPEGQELFELDQQDKTCALNGIDHVLLIQENLKKCVNNYAAAIVIDTCSKYAVDVLTIDFASLYPTCTILNNLDSSSLCYWSEFKVYIRGLDIYVDPFDKNFIRSEACQIKINKVYMNILTFFIRPNILKSITSELQIKLSEERTSVRKKMKNLTKNDVTEYQFLEASQLAIKRVMNSIYGTTGCSIYSSSSIFVSSEITKKARNQLFTLYMYSLWYCWKRNLYDFIKIVYGDTDSLFTVYNTDKITKDYMIKLNYEYKRYPSLNKIYKEDLKKLIDSVEKKTKMPLNELDYENVVKKKWNLDKAKNWLDLNIEEWIQVGNTKDENDVDFYYILNKKTEFIDNNVQINEFINLRNLLEYNGSDKWSILYNYLSLEIRPFDRNLIEYIQKDILHKFSFLPRNRILKYGSSWNDLKYYQRENEKEFIGATNIDQISELVVTVNFERFLENIFIFKKKNYISNCYENGKTHLYSRGGVLYNSKQPIPVKNFLDRIWNIFRESKQYLSNEAKSQMKTAFEEYLSSPNTFFNINCKIGRELTTYKNTNVWLDQLFLINRLGLAKLDAGDVFSKSFYNYFFQGPFMGQKIDKNNKFHVKYLKEKKESNLLIENLVEQVKKNITQQEVEKYIELFGRMAHSQNLIEQTKKYFFKFDINDLELDKEIILYKNICAAISEFVKTIRNQTQYFLDFEECFQSNWLKYFGSIFVLNIKKNLPKKISKSEPKNVGKKNNRNDKKDNIKKSRPKPEQLKFKKQKF